MYQEPQKNRLVQIVDFLWDHKGRFVVLVAAFFFAIHGLVIAVQSIKDPNSVHGDAVPEVDATSTVAVSVESENSEPATSSQSVQSSQPITKSVTTPTKNTTQSTSVSTQTIVQQNLPNHIVISRIGVDVAVANPQSTNINVLNDQLTRTVVRYNGSGTLTQGNMLIMGHSSELRVIHNPLYKVFTKLKYLVPGDEITVSGDSISNTYRVTSVKMLNINDDEAYIPFSTGDNKLTLVTCNVLGEKDQRYIVEASLVASN